MSKVVDGIFYEDVTLAPDLGSLKSEGKGSKRTYYGPWSDADKLPIYPWLEIGDANLIEEGVGLHYCQFMNGHWYDASNGQLVK